MEIVTPSMFDDEIEVSISAIEHYSYCPRQCALIHIEQTFDENVYTIKGRLAHERVDNGDNSPSRGIRTVRGIPLWSDQFCLRGKADLVEFREDIPYPVEYKLGQRRESHADLQLCAQALCLEEMLAVPVPRGAIFYVSTKQRYEVQIDTALRNQTIEIIANIREMLRLQSLPAAPNDKRCRNCSLINSCIPGVVGEPARLQSLQGVLFQPISLGEVDA